MIGQRVAAASVWSGSVFSLWSFGGQTRGYSQKRLVNALLCAFYYCKDAGCRLLFILISEKTSNSQSFIHIQQMEDSPQEGASWVNIRLILHTLTHIKGQSIVAGNTCWLDLQVQTQLHQLHLLVIVSICIWFLFVWFCFLCFCVHHSNFYWTFITQINTK